MPLLSYILVCVCPPDEVAAEKLKAGDAVMVNGKAMQLREVGWIMSWWMSRRSPSIQITQ